MFVATKRVVGTKLVKAERDILGFFAKALENESKDMYEKLKMKYEPFSEFNPTSEQRFVLALVEGEIVGMAIWIPHNTDCVLSDIYVDPAIRNNGVGTVLIREVLEWMETEFPERTPVLGVIANNHKAISLYKRMGFNTTINISMARIKEHLHEVTVYSYIENEVVITIKGIKFLITGDGVTAAWNFDGNGLSYSHEVMLDKCTKLGMDSAHVLYRGNFDLELISRAVLKSPSRKIIVVPETPFLYSERDEKIVRYNHNMELIER